MHVFTLFSEQSVRCSISTAKQTGETTLMSLCRFVTVANLLKSPSRKCVEIPFLAKAMLPSAEAAPLHAEAVPQHAEVMPLQDTLSTPDFTGIAITLNTPFCLHRPQKFSNFVYRKGRNFKGHERKSQSAH